MQAMKINERIARAFLSTGSWEPTAEEQRILDVQQAQDFLVGFDSLQIVPTREWEEGTWRKRLYVASGLGGVARLNLDEQNGLQVIHEENLGTPISRVVKQGAGLFAAAASVEAEPPDAQTCTYKLGGSGAQGLLALNYQDGEDPLQVNAPASLPGSGLLRLDDGWLMGGGVIRSAAWVQCPGWSESLDKAIDADAGSINTLNLFDPAQRRSYAFTGNPRDALVYGRYLLVALGGGGLEIVNREQPAERVRVELGQPLQSSNGRGVKLHLAGSLLFVAAESGVVVVDIREPMQPKVVSAGNEERIEALDLFNNRLVAGSGKQGLTLLELPGALVMDASVRQDGVLPAEEQALQLTFNEPVTLESLRAEGAIRLSELDGDEQSLAAPIVEALDGDGQSATRVTLRFAPRPGAHLRLRLNEARNLRGSGLWAPFQVDFRMAPAGATQPRISHLQNASFHRGAQDTVVIRGSGFSPSVKAFVNQYPVEVQWLSSERLEIAAHALDLLPLSPGQWHLRLDDGGLRDDHLGALLVGDEQPLEQVRFSVTPDSAGKQGGQTVAIAASHASLMPGTRVVLRARHGDTEIYTGRSPLVEAPGVITIDLQDDVRTQKAFTFTLPGVIDPDIYDIFLRIPSGASTREIKVGSLSYTLPKGLGVVLPNYPPMQVGAAQAVDDLLFIGVKAGQPASASNRFLMQAGLEIYDIGLWERPIRLSQLRLDNPVLGLEVLDKVVYLANDRRGVSVVDINNLSQPLLVSTLSLPNHRALDVAVEIERRVLAVAASNDLGTGYVRFLPLARNELGAPAPLPNIAFDGSLRADLLGAPVDVQWLNGELYVLFLRDKQLHLAHFKGFGEQLDYRVQAVERGHVEAASISAALSLPSLQVQQGLISIATGASYLLLEADAQGHYETIYWQKDSGELFGMGGQIMQGNGKGVEINTQPYLAVAASTPGNGAVIGVNEPVRVSFNNLINSDAAHLAEAVRILDGEGQPLAAQFYELSGSNTLRGGLIEMRFKGDYQGGLRIEIGQALLDLQGHALRQPFVLQLERRVGVRPQVDQVVREVDGVAGLHYFHATGGELALVRGSGFGVAAEQLAVWLGETRLASEQIVSLSDSELRVQVPDLQLGGVSATLPVKVERLDQNLAYIRQGAITILPQIEIDDLQPKTYPPQGATW